VPPRAEPDTFDLDGERLVRPDHAGRGLANIAPTVLRLLGGGADGLALPPLDDSVLPERLTQGIRKLVVLVADGLGHLQLVREIEAGNAPNLGSLLRRASYTPITSVFPTTTVAALGALNSGVLPVEHGLLAYTLYLREYGFIAEMIRWGPLTGGTFMDPPYGDSPEHFLWATTLYRRLQAAGVEHTYAINPAVFAATALTRMLHQGARYVGYVATSSITTIVPRLLAEASGPTYVYAYWPTIDTISHVHGPLSDEHSAEVATFDATLGRLLDRLAGRNDTLLLLTADHGHVQTGPEYQVRFGEHPQLLDMLVVPPAGERRAVYLHPLPGRAAEVAAYVRERLTEVAAVITRDAAVEAGLFGLPALPPRAAERIGEVLVFPRRNLQLIPPGDPPPTFRGLHGGLTPEEALVPLLALRV
jgi:type I phosphodiesterase/nucleotide pyrophosphatase